MPVPSSGYPAGSEPKRPEPTFANYLIGKGVEPDVAEGRAEAVAVPLSVTRRGALAFGRKA
jgi:hypothetical protein